MHMPASLTAMFAPFVVCHLQNLLSRAEAIAVCASADFVGNPLPAEWASTPEGVQKNKGKLYAAEAQARRAGDGSIHACMHGEEPAWLR